MYHSASDRYWSTVVVEPLILSVRYRDRRYLGIIYYDSRADWIEINDDLSKFGGADGMQPLD